MLPTSHSIHMEFYIKNHVKESHIHSHKKKNLNAKLRRSVWFFIGLVPIFLETMKDIKSLYMESTMCCVWLWPVGGAGPLLMLVFWNAMQ